MLAWVVPSATVEVLGESHRDDWFEDIIALPTNYDALVVPRAVPNASAASPEEALGLPRGPRSDVFAVGELWWLTLAGRAPFARENLLVSLDALRAAELPPMARRLPAQVEDLLRATLAADPERRPASLQHLVDALTALVDECFVGRRLAAVARGLFPDAAASADAFAEEARLLPTAQPTQTTVRFGPASRVPVPGRHIRAATRLVRNSEFVAWSRAVERTVVDRRTLAPDQPALGVGPADAEALARFLGGRLPTDAEWSALAAGGSLDRPSRCGVGELCRC